MKKFLSLVLAVVMTFSLLTVAASAKTTFSDKSSITYGEAVDVLTAIKAIDGYTDGSFQPTANVTRGAAAKIICNLVLGPTTASALAVDSKPFSDVAVSNVFAGYIAYCSQQGIISGYADGTFKPTANVTGYQFLKMLLGALGYDAKTEGFTGANWSVNVAKLASSLKLTDGNKGFTGTKAATREEACLYAFNTLKGTMVEYNNAGTTVTIGNTVVSTAASKASDVANSTLADNTIKKDGKMQFAEKYFPKLKLASDGTDAFERPANTWTFESKSVGTYAKAADLSYTASVKVGTIYSDLGLSKGIAAASTTVYEDGLNSTTNATAWTAFDITKGDTTHSIGGNGALTEVYYDSDAGTVTIVVVNTYLGKISAAYAATATKDAYVEFTAKTGSGSNYETTESYAVNDYVLYTYSSKAADTGVKSMVKATSATGTLTAYTIAKSVTVAGTTYSANTVAASKATIDSTLTSAVKTDVTVYLDTYGYAIYVDATAASDNYAVVLSYNGVGSVGTNATRTVTLLMKDGTTKTVTSASNSTAFSGSGKMSAGKAGDSGDIDDGDIVSYAINSDGEYILKELCNGELGRTSVAIITKGTVAMNLSTSFAGAAAQANGKTVFLFKNGTTYSVYTGVANVPTVTTSATAKTVASYVKSGSNYASLVFVDVTGAAVTSTSKDVIFVKGSSDGASHDSDLGDYYTYDAVVNGEIKSIKTDTKFANDTMITSIGTNSKGVYTVTKTANNTTGNFVDATQNLGADLVYAPCTTSAKNEAVSNGSLTLAGNIVSVASDCKVFMVSADGKTITASSVAAIGTDDNDMVWYKTTTGDVTTIVIKKVDPAGSGVVGTTTATVTGITAVSGTKALTVTVASTSATGATTASVALSIMNNQGTFTFLKNVDVTIAAVQTSTPQTITGLVTGATYQVSCNGKTDVCGVN
ncbi:MAG: S-layer homology domain-containing protein [Oscillibacter sp.]|nr:S-layer homology domain-containing protein [Oscillibacter sp.]